MSKKRKTILSVAVFGVFLLVCVALYGTVSETDSGVSNMGGAEQELSSAPDFTAKDKDGSMVSFSSMQGKPIVLNFWTTWCPNCVVEMPEFQEVYAELGDEVQFVMVNAVDGYKEREEDGRKFISSKGYTFPVYYDVNQEASINYGVSAIPVTYFVTADGKVAARAMGGIDAETIKKGIEMAKQL